ncbi:hypothetical protein DFJ58DRAFT_744241 [Suillus subalutaceus]|uniref:uncharacterized protein n=1 Tax=Suillus subalutaceus TaxID=48586 RepID=UPI001B86B098|nr:uncharacterized protein DFJ58DRAFT_744241 [Suillus subalutaceus]KAG1861588.1 hypothetical protein DFJ58DRAFT_744241 [Suillus subalutaceus]
MDTKLRALKVQELKEILSKASIPPGNAKKQDLINKILANPPAYRPPPPSTDDDLLAPPEEIDWMVEESITVEPASPPKTSEQPLPSPVPAAAALPAPAPAVQSEEDKRKARAARFGTTYVEPVQKQPKKAGENPDVLKARTERFGTVAPVTKGRGKRTAPVENVDSEEQERRRKRAERFGLPLSGKA